MISNQLLPWYKSFHCRRTLLSLNDISNHPKAVVWCLGTEVEFVAPPG